MLRYDDGGLRNVWLMNGYEIKETPYGKGTAYKDVEGLTRAICLALTKKHGKLTGVEFRYLRQSGLMMSQAALAKLMGVDVQSIARWEKTGQVPKYANKLVRVVYCAHAEGNLAIKRVVERINDVDRLLNQRIVLESSSAGWTPRIEDVEHA
ncbi:helix-turn-helix domain-containing protein [Sulfuritalea hydrogenivorans]|jgi:DNA-binding transcriptional regulator YiaG|uniref:HTH cro/C1-type domain-containing protein n=1 Tax=Sulfuritalea hydrogenivorans sk43H TaxID=1223802 RepID=W0S9Z9_9PROT|nr:helix-turn-helix domain-containing protein [Sulfuritalea hydrogenivorans]MDK9713941.1 helix-turn-helix domain-containing protein [Sulfuritalea sp.]BAO28039.1 hypothetical protein SUTH_00222 [Sulfuritalea hydrogenivorans sk43H]